MIRIIDALPLNPLLRNTLMNMKPLTGTQRKYLRGLAHSLKPVVFIGQKGATDALVSALDEAFQTHELIKVKFHEFKEKHQKKEIVEFIEKNSNCLLCGIIGHIAVFFRQNADVEKRKIDLSKIKQG